MNGTSSTNTSNSSSSGSQPPQNSQPLPYYNPYDPYGYGTVSGLTDQMTQLGAVANDATQVVASQASNFAAAASTGGGNNGVPINVAQVNCLLIGNCWSLKV